MKICLYATIYLWSCKSNEWREGRVRCKHLDRILYLEYNLTSFVIHFSPHHNHKLFKWSEISTCIVLISGRGRREGRTTPPLSLKWSRFKNECKTYQDDEFLPMHTVATSSYIQFCSYIREMWCLLKPKSFIFASRCPCCTDGTQRKLVIKPDSQSVRFQWSNTAVLTISSSV